MGARIGKRFMDGPKISLIPAGERGPVTQALARAEEKLYRRICLPDHLFLLDVKSEISALRKPDHNKAVLRHKTRVVDDVKALAPSNSTKPRLICVDANLPFDAVLNELKTKVWEIL
jgi:thymidylate kinase